MRPLLPVLFSLLVANAAHAQFGGLFSSRNDGVIASRELAPGESFFDCPDCPEMVIVPGGHFAMGSTEFDGEKPMHSVKVPLFAIGRTEVTQGQWKSVMGDNPSKYKPCDSCPVEQVSWEDAQIFLQRLRAKTGKPYRLPSEAEWEYACRAGTSHRFCGGNDLKVVAWTDANSNGTPHPVGRKKANGFGLHDMSGNVWEWVGDCWKGDYIGAPKDGSVRDKPDCKRRVLRGGSWIDHQLGARSTERGWGMAKRRDDGDGLRVAVDIAPSAR